MTRVGSPTTFQRSPVDHYSAGTQKILQRFDVYADGINIGFVERGHVQIAPAHRRGGHYRRAIQHLENAERVAIGSYGFAEYAAAIHESLGTRARHMRGSLPTAKDAPCWVDHTPHVEVAIALIRMGYSPSAFNQQELRAFGVDPNSTDLTRAMLAHARDFTGRIYWVVRKLL